MSKEKLRSTDYTDYRVGLINVARYYDNRESLIVSRSFRDLNLVVVEQFHQLEGRKGMRERGDDGDKTVHNLSIFLHDTPRPRQMCTVIAIRYSNLNRYDVSAHVSR